MVDVVQAIKVMKRKDKKQERLNQLRKRALPPSSHLPLVDKLSDTEMKILKEIAIMKKLYHPNLVTLIEVLDDPTEDSLYMVMEMCRKGVVMHVGLQETADPYEEEQCRTWFRDLVLGIEYCTFASFIIGAL